MLTFRYQLVLQYGTVVIKTTSTSVAKPVNSNPAMTGSGNS